MLAEVLRRQEDAAGSAAHRDQAAAWILRSGSIEHLCLLHLTSSRLARGAGETEAAQHAVSAGLQAARLCGLGISFIELLCEQAQVCLCGPMRRPQPAFARSALERALAADCQFRWGAAEACASPRRFPGRAEEYRDARAALEMARDLRERIKDPRLAETIALLRR